MTRHIADAEHLLELHARYRRWRLDLEAALRDLQAIRRRGLELRDDLAGKSRRRVRRSDIRSTGMTVRETAAVLDRSEAHIRRLLRRGELIGVHLGGRAGWRLSRRYVRLIADQQACAGGALRSRMPRRS